MVQNIAVVIKKNAMPLLCAVFILFAGCFFTQPKRITGREYDLNTICSITVVNHSAAQANQAIALAFANTRRIDTLFGYGKKSIPYEINNLAGKTPVAVTAEVMSLVRLALKVSSASNGAFDISIGPLVDLWNIQGTDSMVPDSASIAARKYLVDYKKIILDTVASTIFLADSGMKLDFGGIAKGYAVSSAANVLRANGIEHALINFGGDILVFGGAEPGKQWHIGIQHPRKTDSILAVVSCNDLSLVTSGDYERYFTRNNVRYHHILSPFTGYPARGVISVSILTQDNTLADGLSTALFVLGPEAGLKLLEQYEGAKALFVVSDHDTVRIIQSPDLQRDSLLISY